jgi:hypothetical protein
MMEGGYNGSIGIDIMDMGVMDVMDVMEAGWILEAMDMAELYYYEGGLRSNGSPILSDSKRVNQSNATIM